MTVQLKIDGVPLSDLEAKSLVQSYDELSDGHSSRRSADGTPIPQCFYIKRSTTISGESWEKPSMEGMQRRTDYEVSCAAPLAVRSASTTIAIPADARPDTPILAYALVDGAWEETDYYAEAGNLVLTAVELAAGYKLEYYPLWTMQLVQKRITHKLSIPGWDWQLDFEET